MNEGQSIQGRASYVMASKQISRQQSQLVLLQKIVVIRYQEYHNPFRAIVHSTIPVHFQVRE